MTRTSSEPVIDVPCGARHLRMHCAVTARSPGLRNGAIAPGLPALREPP